MDIKLRLYMIPFFIIIFFDNASSTYIASQSGHFAIFPT